MASKRPNFSLTDTDRELLKQIAKRYRLSEAEVVRRLIRCAAADMKLTAQPQVASAPPVSVVRAEP